MSPAPVPVAAELAMNAVLPYQFHQVAMYVPDIDAAVEMYRDLGFQRWSRDEADLIGRLDGHETVTRAHMAFNYDVFPGELEFLSYKGPSRYSHLGDDFLPFISHMSTYVDDVYEATEDMIEVLGFGPFHRFITANNTNPRVAGKKRFIESIFDTRKTIGFDLKLIQKVPWDYHDNNWLNWEPPSPVHRRSKR